MRFILNSTLYLLVLAVCLSIISASQNVAFADDSLDGKSFLVKLSEHGKKDEATNDELIFKDGTFFSADCEQYGFSPASYKTMSKGDTTLFESTLMSDKEGKAEWEGAVKGDEISGTFIWSKEGQEPIIYSYKGSIKK
jgi:high-affinity K+ transport system ATPase subunit B